MNKEDIKKMRKLYTQGKLNYKQIGERFGASTAKAYSLMNEEGILKKPESRSSLEEKERSRRRIAKATARTLKLKNLLEEEKRREKYKEEKLALQALEKEMNSKVLAARKKQREKERNRKWNEFTKMWNEGKTVMELGKHFKLSEWSVYAQCGRLKSLGFKLDRRLYKGMNKNKKNRIVKLWNSNVPAGVIAEEISIKQSSLYNKISNMRKEGYYLTNNRKRNAK